MNSRVYVREIFDGIEMNVKDTRKRIRELTSGNQSEWIWDYAG